MASDDPVLRQQLARVYLEGELLKLISDRAISAELHGRADGTGGQHRQAAVERGRAAHHRGRVRRCSAPTRYSGTWGRDRVYSRALTIAGGTTQVNKNIVAQRILGLPARLTGTRRRGRGRFQDSRQQLDGRRSGASPR